MLLRCCHIRKMLVCMEGWSLDSDLMYCCQCLSRNKYWNEFAYLILHHDGDCCDCQHLHNVSCIVDWEKKTKGIYLASKCNLQQLLSFYLLLLSQQYKVRKAVLWDSQFYRYFELGLQFPNMLNSLQLFLYLYNASVLYVLFSSGCSSDKFIIWWAGVSQRILSR